MAVDLVAENEIGDAAVVGLWRGVAMRQEFDASPEVERSFRGGRVEIAEMIRRGLVVRRMKHHLVERGVAGGVGEQDERDDDVAIRERSDLAVERLKRAAPEA